MKEINIKIRFDDDKGLMGFAIDRTKEDFDDITETLKLVTALDMLRDREKSRIFKTQTFKTEYDS